MLAFGLAIFVFYLFTLIGVSLVPKKLAQFDKTFSLFISPAIGLAFSTLFIFTANRLGLPVKYLKIPLIIFILGSLVTGIVRNKFHVLPRQTLLKFLLAPLGILFTAWPVLRYGFSWISYVNDDMNNYVLAATRFYNYGFFSKPNASLYSGTDYSQEYYFFHVISAVRPGSELFVSAFSNLHSGDALAVFMPSIMTLQLVLIFTILAISRTLQRPSRLKTRLAYVLSILLPLSSLGYLYQLIGQVGGLAIGTAVIAISIIIFKQEHYQGFRSVFLLLSLFMAVQLIWYPEFLPFIAIPLLMKVLLAKKHQRKKLWLGFGAVIILGVLALNKYFFQAVKFGVTQIVNAQKSVTGVDNAQIFPYFLKPHGLAAYLGILPINRVSQDPWESVAIVSAISLILILLYLIFKHKLYEDLPVSIFLLIFLVFVYLVAKNNGFGAFKISMYVEPYLIITLTIIFELVLKMVVNRRYIRMGVFFLITSMCVLSARTAEFYTNASTGNSTNGFNEIIGGSGVGMKQHISSALSAYKSNFGPVTSVALNLSQIKLEAIAAQGTPLIFPTTDVFSNIYGSTVFPSSNIARSHVVFKSQGVVNYFEQPKISTIGTSRLSWFLESNNKFEAINHSQVSMQSSNWNYRLVRNPVNTLIFIDSSLGHSYCSWVGERSKAVIFQAEKNPMIGGTYMQSIGDNLLFEIINPSSHPYFVLNASTTVIPQYNRRIPPISVWGLNQFSLPTVGRGTMRTYIPLPSPVLINGHKYIQLHIEQVLKPFPAQLSLASKIYGNNIKYDSRRIALFASDISVVDRSKLKIQDPPTAIYNFPSDLERSNLYYSGIYEDGWIGSDSYFDLSDKGKTMLVVKGSVPLLKTNPKFRTSVSLSVNGKVLITKELKGGSFTVSAPWTNGINSLDAKRVSIHFSNEQKLPAPDGRPASAQITFIGFK